MPSEPAQKRAFVFVDGQNLFSAAKAAFGYRWANYRFPHLGRMVCEQRGWHLEQTRFYTGMPSQAHDPRLHAFWSAKLLVMSNEGVQVCTRPLRYRRKVTQLADGRIEEWFDRTEKGVDVRLALDVVRLAVERTYDVALIFSQDQDLSELCTDIREIARDQNRWIRIASAYPWSEAVRRSVGLRNSEWIRVLKPEYDRCLDPSS